MNKLHNIGNYWNKPNHAAYLFVLPSFVLLVIFSMIPMIGTTIISLFDMDLFFNGKGFVGFANYIEAFNDKRFWNGLWITTKFTLIEVPVQMIVGLFLAALVSKNTILNKFFRGIYFLPIICSATATAIMWRMFLHSNIGMVTLWLEKLGIRGINFLNDPKLTFYVIVFMSIWRSFGISTVILVAAIQNVPRDLFEAADLDGCPKYLQFFKITLPIIQPTFIFVLMTRMIGSLQVFDLIFTTTNGGPNYTTESLVQYIYTRAFSVTNRLGYASAMSEVLFAIIMILTIIVYRKMFMSDKSEG